jgi:2-keto-4-pentenoate hydratase/2-oxohepta-3-ene-1,7-dioic acid hydratase in catechol pathway
VEVAQHRDTIVHDVEQSVDGRADECRAEPVVVGDRDAAWDAIAGLTVGQDLSERLLQLAGKPPQFSLAKSHPGFGPIGPVAVTPDDLPDRDDLGFESHLDGELLQHGRTSEMIFPVDDLVARISAVCPLLPGDLVFTGTPAGVGNRRTPPRFLQDGQTLVSRVEGLGEIRQRFTRRSPGQLRPEAPS